LTAATAAGGLLLSALRTGEIDRLLNGVPAAGALRLPCSWRRRSAANAGGVIDADDYVTADKIRELHFTVNHHWIFIRKDRSMPIVYTECAQKSRSSLKRISRNCWSKKKVKTKRCSVLSQQSGCLKLISAFKYCA